MAEDTVHLIQHIALPFLGFGAGILVCTVAFRSSRPKCILLGMTGAMVLFGVSFWAV